MHQQEQAVFVRSIVFIVLGHLNDLWKFDGKNWTWISGSDEIDQPAVFGTKRVPDSSNVPGGRYCAVSWIDSSDNLYLFGGYGYAESENGFNNFINSFYIF